MARPKSIMYRLTFPFLPCGKKQLKNLARIYCVEEGTTITFFDLMRRGIQEKYQLGETDDELGTIS